MPRMNSTQPSVVASIRLAGSSGNGRRLHRLETGARHDEEGGWNVGIPALPAHSFGDAPGRRTVHGPFTLEGGIMLVDRHACPNRATFGSGPALSSMLRYRRRSLSATASSSFDLLNLQPHSFGSAVAPHRCRYRTARLGSCPQEGEASRMHADRFDVIKDATRNLLAFAQVANPGRPPYSGSKSQTPSVPAQSFHP